MKKFNELRKKYPEFVYHSFDIKWSDNDIEIQFKFSIPPDIHFRPSIIIPAKKFDFKIGADHPVVKNIAFHIGMIELVSYWKCACPAAVIVEAGALNAAQVQWWKKLYFKGLGEFFYVNDIEIDIDLFMDIQVQSEASFNPSTLDNAAKNLIPVGGGKDSIVTLAALSPMKERNTCLIMNPREASLQSIYRAGYSDDGLFEIHRRIDAKLLSLNKAGFLNGHTPFSAMLAFNAAFAAALLGVRFIVLSNEASANESTVANTDINHQYSKSLEFERDFHDYFRNYISPDIYYFSLLRPLSELQIARKFAAQDDRFFSIFKSCNVGSKADIWCGKCSKCLFVFIILAPFLDLQKLQKIFGANLFEDESLWRIFRQLIGVEDVKPFDCVGTVEETNAALSMALHQNPAAELPLLLRRYREEFPDLILSPDRVNALLNHFNHDHLLPESFKKFI